MSFKSKDHHQYVEQVSAKSHVDSNSVTQGQKSVVDNSTQQISNEQSGIGDSLAKQLERDDSCNTKSFGFIILVCLVAVAVMIGIAVQINTLFVHPEGKDKLANHDKNKIEESIKVQNEQVQNNPPKEPIQKDEDFEKLKEQMKRIQESLKQKEKQIEALKNKAQSQNTKKQEQNLNKQKEQLYQQQEDQTQIENQTQIQEQQSDETQDEIQNKQQGKVQQGKTQEKISVQQISKENFRIRQKPRARTPNVSLNGDHYEFTISIEKVLEQSAMKFSYPNEDSQWAGIKKPEYERAIRLMEVTHNINFKGEYVLDHFNFYESAEAKYKALKKAVDEEKAFFEKKYEISKYIHDQIGICVYIPSYNNAKFRYYLRNLDSVFQQEYQNYHVVYVNDASTDGTGDFVKAYMEENEIPSDKYTLINNPKNKGNCANIYNAGHHHCKEGEIMVLLDGDDALIGRQVFSVLNAVYQKEKVALTYGQFLLVRDNRVSNGFSRSIPEKSLIDGTFRQMRSFFTSHLKTMYVDVFRKIKVSDLQYANGTFYDYASDVTYMTPAVQLVGTRLKYLNEIQYEYRFDTGNNEPHGKQITVQQQVYDKKPSKVLSSMEFADFPKTVHYD